MINSLTNIYIWLPKYQMSFCDSVFILYIHLAYFSDAYGDAFNRTTYNTYNKFRNTIKTKNTTGLLARNNGVSHKNTYLRFPRSLMAAVKAPLWQRCDFYKISDYLLYSWEQYNSYSLIL